MVLGLTPIEEYQEAECDEDGPGGDPPVSTGWLLAREFLWGDRFPEPLATL